MNREIAQRIKELRGDKSQKVFADEIGVSFRAYCYYESGERNPPVSVVTRISKLCGVSVDWILTGQETGADRTAESTVGYGLDDATQKVVAMMKEMDKKGRADVLKYVEAQKLWRENKLKEG